MIKVDVDLSGFTASLDNMVKQLNELPQEMAGQMTEWQTEDMNRKYPNTSFGTAGNVSTAETDIWPRSRKDLAQPKRRLPVRALRRRQREKRARGTMPSPSTRPILRQSLWTQLVTRMTRLLETVRWQ